MSYHWLVALHQGCVHGWGSASTDFHVMMQTHHPSWCRDPLGSLIIISAAASAATQQGQGPQVWCLERFYLQQKEDETDRETSRNKSKKNEMIVFRLTAVACPLFWSQTLALIADIILFLFFFFAYDSVKCNNHPVVVCLIRSRLAKAATEEPVLHRHATACTSPDQKGAVNSWSRKIKVSAEWNDHKRSQQQQQKKKIWFIYIRYTIRDEEKLFDAGQIWWTGFGAKIKSQYIF